MDKSASVLWIIVFIMTVTLVRASLMMVPEKTQLMVPEGSKLELQCIHQYRQGTTPESVYFMKDGRVLNELYSGSNLIDNLRTDTSTYTKENATMLDTARYQYVLQPSGTTSDIQVYVFRLPTREPVTLVEGEAAMHLTCDLQDVPTSRYEVSWAKDNVTLEDGAKYKKFGNVLQISDPKRADIGEYECIITFFPDSDRDRHIIRPGFVAVEALMMVPERGYYILFDGDPLKIQCIHQYKNRTDNVLFRKDGVAEPKFELVSSSEVAGIWTSVYAYIKESVSRVDTGRYSCVLDESGETSDIRVHVLRSPILKSKTLVDGLSSVDLQCGVLLHEDDLQRITWSVSWERNNQTITNSSNYILIGEILRILKPDRADIGKYACTITFFPELGPERQSLNPGFATLNAPPVIDSHDNNKNVKLGDDLELKCAVSGYPLPKVQWFKGSVNMSSDQRIHFEIHSAIKGAKLMIHSVNYDDMGNYSCVATNEIRPYKATAVMKVQVYDTKETTSASETYKAGTLMIVACFLVKNILHYVQRQEVY